MLLVTVLVVVGIMLLLVVGVGVVSLPLLLLLLLLMRLLVLLLLFLIFGVAAVVSSPMSASWLWFGATAACFDSLFEVHAHVRMWPITSLVCSLTLTSLPPLRFVWFGPSPPLTLSVLFALPYLQASQALANPVEYPNMFDDLDWALKVSGQWSVALKRPPEAGD